MRFHYEAYGLTFELPFECDVLGATCAAGAPTAPDVVVHEGSVPRRLAHPQRSEISWDASPGLFLVRGGSGSGRFLVSQGEVVVERNSECDDTRLARCFVNQVLPAVLRQRGLLVLHANAVKVGDGVVLIGGDSGAGKSTTLAALLYRGYRMVSDDVTALKTGSEAEGVDVVPGVAQTHLTEDSATRLGYEIDPAQLQPWRRMKAAIPTRRSMATGPAPLRMIVFLSIHDVQ